jgi:hypothetical protein
MLRYSLLTDLAASSANLGKIDTKPLGFFVQRCSIDAKCFSRCISTPVMLT